MLYLPSLENNNYLYMFVYKYICIGLNLNSNMPGGVWRPPSKREVEGEEVKEEG